MGSFIHKAKLNSCDVGAQNTRDGIARHLLWARLSFEGPLVHLQHRLLVDDRFWPKPAKRMTNSQAAMRRPGSTDSLMPTALSTASNVFKVGFPEGDSER